MIKRLLFILFSISLGISSLHAQTPAANDLSQACQQIIGTPSVKAYPDAKIRILSPAPDAVVYGESVAVTVETENFPLNNQGQHWHLWVDVEMTSMVYNPMAVIQLPAGQHLLCAVLGDDEHGDVGIPVGVEITVIEPQTGTPRSTLAILAPPPSPASANQADDPLGLTVVIAVVVIIGLGSVWLGLRSRKTP